MKKIFFFLSFLAVIGCSNNSNNNHLEGLLCYTEIVSRSDTNYFRVIIVTDEKTIWVPVDSITYQKCTKLNYPSVSGGKDVELKMYKISAQKKGQNIYQLSDYDIHESSNYFRDDDWPVYAPVE